jgi:hypothetical protein
MTSVNPSVTKVSVIVAENGGTNVVRVIAPGPQGPAGPAGANCFY